MRLSRDHILARGQGQGNTHFPCSAATMTSRISNLTRLINLYSTSVMTIHTDIDNTYLPLTAILRCHFSPISHWIQYVCVPELTAT